MVFSFFFMDGRRGERKEEGRVFFSSLSSPRADGRALPSLPSSMATPQFSVPLGETFRFFFYPLKSSPAPEVRRVASSSIKETTINAASRR